jgi:hypothetical protein
VFGGGSGHKCVIDGAASDAELCEYGVKSLCTLSAEESRAGEVMRSSRATARGVLRLGGGILVSTENVSNAAWPLRPQLRLPTAFLVAW